MYIQIILGPEQTTMAGIDQSVAQYKSMDLMTDPPAGKDGFLDWARQEMSAVHTKERELKNAIAQERARLKQDLLRLNAVEHDLLYTADQHPVHVKIAVLKKERFC